ncbi:MAG: hypothetical protein GHCLOJNM_00579 [bacterium]|nr:hypothetical protein [bacterium]
MRARRRGFLKTLSGAWLGSLVSDTSASPAQPHWRMAIGLNGFASAKSKYGIDYPLQEVLDFAQEEGFEGVELVDGWPEGGYPKAEDSNRVGKLRNLHDSFGLQVFSIQTGAADAFSPRLEERERYLETFADRCDLARALGGECIGLWPHGDLRGQNFDQALENLCKSFQRVGEIAAARRLVASFEIEPPFVFNSEDHLIRILKGANHPNLKVIYDPSHFDLMNGSTGRPHEPLRRVGVSNIGYLHLTDTDGALRDGGTSKHLPCGEGHVDLPASFETLWSGGFSGWIMVDSWETPDPYKACRKGKQAVEMFLSSAARGK